MKLFGHEISKHVLFRVSAVLLTLLVLGAGVGVYAKYVREVSVKGNLTVSGGISGGGESMTEDEESLDPENEGRAITEEPAITDEPAETYEPAETDEPISAPEAITYDLKAEIEAEIEEGISYYLFIEIDGGAELDSHWKPVDGANGRHGGSVFVYANGDAPAIVDVDGMDGVLVNDGGNMQVRLSCEAIDTPSLYGYIVPAYDGASPASLFNNAE